MREYNFITYWNVNAPVEKVWEIIRNVLSWPQWWHGVLEVKELAAGDSEGSGARFAHTWQSILPYKLKFTTEISRVILYECIEADVTGELEGTGRWDFKNGGNGNTFVAYHWNVRTTRAWMNISGPFLSGVFRWNHNAVMRWGATGIADNLNCSVKFSTFNGRHSQKA